MTTYEYEDTRGQYGIISFAPGEKTCSLAAGPRRHQTSYEPDAARCTCRSFSKYLVADVARQCARPRRTSAVPDKSALVELVSEDRSGLARLGLVGEAKIAFGTFGPWVPARR